MLHSLECAFPTLFSYYWPLLSISDGCQEKWPFCLWFTYFVSLCALKSLLCKWSGHLSPQCLWLLSDVSWSVDYFILEKTISLLLTWIFLENTVISTCGKRLSWRHWSRKEKRGEQPRGRSETALVWRTIFLCWKTLWTVTNKLYKDTLCQVLFVCVLASNHVISGIMYRTVIIGKISPFRTDSIHYPLC